MKAGRSLAAIDTGQIVRFCIVGGASLVVYLAVIFAAMEFAELAATWASVLAYGVAICVNYGLQRNWTFRSRRAHAVAAPRFLAVHIAGMGLNAVSLGVLVDGMDWPYWTGQAVGIALVAAWSYIFQKFVVFGESER